MKTDFLSISPEQEQKKITTFLQKTFAEQGVKRAVLGMSGGIDSTTSFYLLKEVLPLSQIFVARLSYFDREPELIDQTLHDLKFPEQNLYSLSINPIVEAAKKTAGITDSEADVKIRIGNIMARSRMILLYDLAKKHNALVCGTENKSEMLLGYFTRFGDEASDVEPIQHLYKTQIYQLAKHLGVPAILRNQIPSAGLWEGQTDEEQLGFTYAEADAVLYLYTEKKLSLKTIIQAGYPHAKDIIQHMHKNDFKHHVPYTIPSK